MRSLVIHCVLLLGASTLLSLAGCEGATGSPVRPRPDTGTDLNTCGPGTCSGCCASGACLLGDTLTACGSGGAACLTCSATQSCVEHACVDGCTDACTDGEKRCSGTEVQACTKQASGCADWQTTEDCATSGKACSAGSCVTTCTNSCTEGLKQCSGSSVQTCTKQLSGCTDWQTTEDCAASSKVCSGGVCTTTCTNSCTEGLKQCSGSNVQACTKQTSGCTDWQTTEDCATSSKICSGGLCTATCTNICTEGLKQCSGLNVQTCFTQTSGCTDWQTTENCGTSSKICSGGLCTATCTNNCTEGLKQCLGTNAQTCTQQTSGCTDWQTTENCAASSKVCSGGVCTTTCTNNCTEGLKQCSGTDAQTCTKQTSGCTDWQTTENCATSGKTCSDGVCIGGCDCNPWELCSAGTCALNPKSVWAVIVYDAEFDKKPAGMYPENGKDWDEGLGVPQANWPADGFVVAKICPGLLGWTTPKYSGSTPTVDDDNTPQWNVIPGNLSGIPASELRSCEIDMTAYDKEQLGEQRIGGGTYGPIPESKLCHGCFHALQDMGTHAALKSLRLKLIYQYTGP